MVDTAAGRDAAATALHPRALWSARPVRGRVAGTLEANVNLLVLGGGFPGFHVVAEAVAADRTVATFNRDGKSELAGEGNRTRLLLASDEGFAFRGRCHLFSGTPSVNVRGSREG